MTVLWCDARMELVVYELPSLLGEGNFDLEQSDPNVHTLNLEVYYHNPIFLSPLLNSCLARAYFCPALRLAQNEKF